MNLEQRVQVLEQELQILKNQIEATLLDIQENLLTNAYPSLRAAEPPAVENKEAAQQPNVHRVSMKEIEAPPVTDEDTAEYPPIHTPVEAPAAPKAVTAKLREETLLAAPAPLRRVTPQLEEETQPASPLKNLGRTGDEFSSEDWAALSKLEEWTRQRIADIGAPATRALIEQYMLRRKLTAEVANALLQFIAAFENAKWNTEPKSEPGAPSQFLQQFVDSVAAGDVNPQMFLKEEHDFDNNGVIPFVTDVTNTWEPQQDFTIEEEAPTAPPIRIVSGDNPHPERRSRRQLIGRLIAGLKNVESEV